MWIHVYLFLAVFCNLSSVIIVSLWLAVLHLVSIYILLSSGLRCGCWQICDTAAEPLQQLQTKNVTDTCWEMDRKTQRLEPLLELWCCYFHTSASLALSTRPPSSSDWTGSITVFDWNRLRCCFYYILHPPSSPHCCPTSWLRTPLVIFLLCACSVLS